MNDLVTKLQEIVPDLSDIRTNHAVTTAYAVTNYRTLDAFQVSLIQEVTGEFDTLTVVDVGDSSGRHLQYLRGLNPLKAIGGFSINVDPLAIDRIRSKGLYAVRDRAENVSQHAKDIDVVLCFEVLEHLTDPSGFLRRIAYETTARYLVMTVPYVRSSRVGLSYIREHWRGGPANPENIHIFELSPSDWKLLVRHSGWEVRDEKIYCQYPRRGLYRLTKLLWKHYDYEGFLGMVLRKDHTYSDRYQSW